MDNSPKYLDSASTTPVDKRVFDAMYPYFSNFYGNASSNHFFGKQAKVAIEEARNHVSDLINAGSKEIIFTSGATESINLALKGYAEANIEKGNHIITVKTEHKAVLSTCEYLESKGFEVTYLDVDINGLICIDDLKAAIKKSTILISVMYVNNETGVIQPISEIGKIAREYNICFFCDATQAVAKVKIDVQSDNIDMLCLSGHKFNGPKGIGVLYKKEGIELTPLIHGGDQENSLRAGTYNTPFIVGLGKACEIASQNLIVNSANINKHNNYLFQQLKEIKGCLFVGSKNNKVSNIVNVIIPGLNADIFISKNTGFALSTGSACTSQIIQSSHVLKAMGFNDNECRQAIRISINNETTESQINKFVEILKAEINNLI